MGMAAIFVVLSRTSKHNADNGPPRQVSPYMSNDALIGVILGSIIEGITLLAVIFYVIGAYNDRKPENASERRDYTS